MKRLFDICFSAFGMFLLTPIFLVVGLLLLFSSGRPVFYMQERVGRGGKRFLIWKFRTMCVGANTLGPSVTSSGDKRVTRIGRYLRAWKIDELPQLMNVFLGSMSFVGPRPEVPKYVAFYGRDQLPVLDLTPGITDRATLFYRNEEILLAAQEDPEHFYISEIIPKKIEINLEYSRRASFWGDLRIIILTVFVVFWPGLAVRA